MPTARRQRGRPPVASRRTPGRPEADRADRGVPVRPDPESEGLAAGPSQPRPRPADASAQRSPAASRYRIAPPAGRTAWRRPGAPAFHIPAALRLAVHAQADTTAVASSCIRPATIAVPPPRDDASGQAPYRSGMCRSIKTLRRPGRTRRPANWRQPPASTSASSAASVSHRSAIAKRSMPPSRRSRRRRVGSSNSIGVDVEDGPDRWKPGVAAPGPWRDAGSDRAVVGPARPRHRSRRAPADRRARRRASRACSTARRSSCTTAPGSPRTHAGSRPRSPRPGWISASASRSRRTRSPRCCRCSAASAARLRGERRDRRLFAGRGRARDRVRLGAGRDQLHRDQRGRSRLRCPPRPWGPRQPGLDQPEIEHFGRRAPGSRMGIRNEPATGAGYTEHLEY